MICGIAAGVLFYRGSHVAALGAAAACFLGNVLDCADGQLARLQGSASPVGYLVDGAADYIGTIAIFVGMAHSLNTQRPAAVSWWWLTVAAGVSMAWQCAFLDEKRGAWLDRVYRQRRDRSEELRSLLAQAEAWRRERIRGPSRALIAAYAAYRQGWKPLTRSAGAAEISPETSERWAACHRPVLRRSVWVGPTMHATAIVLLGGLLNRPDAYMWLAVSAGNLWMLGVLLAQRKALRCQREA